MKDQIKKVPNLRFKGFTNDWEQRKLGEFGKATGGTSIESEFSSSGTYKVISIGSYSETHVYNDQGIRAKNSEKTHKRILNKNDLTMILNDKTASGRIIGSVLLIPCNNTFVYNQRTERIEPNISQFSPMFLYHYLNAPIVRQKIISNAQGNTQIYVNWSSISKVEYYLPRLNEQNKIGELLKNVSNLISLQQRKVELLKQLKKGLLQKMFADKDSKQPVLRFADFHGDWEQRKLGEISKIVAGGDKDKNLLKQKGKYPVIANSVNTDGIIGYYNDKYRVMAPAITVTGRGDIGHATARFQNFTPVVRLLALTTTHDAIFLTNAINSIRIFNESTGVPQLTSPQLSNYYVSVTDLREETRIGNLLSIINNSITLQQKKLTKLQSTKKFLLQNLFI